MMTVLTVIVVAAVVLVVRATTGRKTTTSLPSGRPRDTPPDSEAQRVLDERFARDDIDEGEYVARPHLLCGRP